MELVKTSGRRVFWGKKIKDYHRSVTKETFLAYCSGGPPVVGRFGGNTSPSRSTGKRRSQNSAINHSELRKTKLLELTKRENCDKASVVCTAKANCKLQCKFQIAKLRNCIPLNCFKYLSVIQCIQC